MNEEYRLTRLPAIRSHSVLNFSENWKIVNAKSGRSISVSLLQQNNVEQEYRLVAMKWEMSSMYTEFTTKIIIDGAQRLWKTISKTIFFCVWSAICLFMLTMSQ